MKQMTQILMPMALIAVLAGARPALANTARWIGIPGVTASTNWSDTNNWSNTAGGVAGAYQNDVKFGGVGSTNDGAEVTSVVDAEQQQKAKGGKLVRFNPSNGRYDLLGIPAPRLYLQSVAADWQRNLLYSFTYPAEAIYRTDLVTNNPN